MKNRPLLSACLIVKNADKYLGKCLTSIQNISQEIVVVDTGSTDSTLEIAEIFTSEIHFFNCIDDFAAAKNFAINKANGEWILAIDADVYLHPVSHEYITKILADNSVIAYSCKLRYTHDQTIEEGNLFLFRNHADKYFHDIIHENISASLKNFTSSGKYIVSNCDLIFDHSGWDDNVKNKYQRDFKLLKKEYHIKKNLYLSLTKSDNRKLEH